MIDRPIELDEHRGMAAQKATELRREIGEIAAQHTALQQRQEELEKFLLSTPTATWFEAVEKARYLLSLFAASAEAQDPRRQKMITDLLSDFERLLDRPD